LIKRGVEIGGLAEVVAKNVNKYADRKRGIWRGKPIAKEALSSGYRKGDRAVLS